MITFMASATEAELGGLFEKYQKSTSMRTALAEMGHQQPPTPVAIDNRRGPAQDVPFALIIC